jgi:hypothetical protein
VYEVPIFAFRRVVVAALCAALAGAVAACAGSSGFGPQRVVATGTLRAAKLHPAASCSSYVPYNGMEGGNSVPGVNLDFADSNASGAYAAANFYVYVSVVLDNTPYYLRTTDGSLQAFPPTGAASTYEYPLNCLAGARPPVQFVLPPDPGAGGTNSARAYISLGTLQIDKYSGPQPNCCQPPCYTPGQASVLHNYGVLWDILEWTYPNIANSGITIDTSQVDSFALPLLLRVTAAGVPQTVGEVPGTYATVVNAVKAASPWNSLIVWQGSNVGTGCPPAGKPVTTEPPLRIMSPKDATTGGSASKLNNPKFSSTYMNAFITKVLNYYALPATAKKVVYVTIGLNSCSSAPYEGGAVICPTYYASSDGKGDFVFTLKTCPTNGGCTAKIVMPATVLEQNPPDATSCCLNGLWGSPFNSTSFSYPEELYLYKALANDFNTGTAMQAGFHPVFPCSALTPSGPAGCATSSTQTVLPIANNYYQDPNLASGLPTLFNGYAAAIHGNFVRKLAYAQAYDDYLNQSTTIGTATTPSSILLTIEQINYP